MDQDSISQQLEQIFARQGYLSPLLQVADVLPRLISDYHDEFFWSDSFDQDFVESLILLGFLPMGYDLSKSRPLLLPKLHQWRSIVKPSMLTLPKNAHRLARDASLYCNRSFDQVLLNCRESHGDGWLSGELLKLLHRLNLSASSRRVKLCSFEIWRGAKLTAGEIGYLWGSIYTSMTGFYITPGDGTVQMSAMASLLFAQGVKLWDLGMPVDYKQRYGCQIVSRAQFDALRREYSQQVIVGTGPIFAGPQAAQKLIPEASN